MTDRLTRRYRWLVSVHFETKRSGEAISLTVAYCLATFPLLLERTGTEKFGLTRIPEEELAFPEEYLQAHEVEDEDLILVDIDEAEEESKSKTDKETEIASEITPLLV